MANMASFRRYFSYVFLLLLLAAAGALYIFKDAAKDYLVLRDYRASSAITQLSVDTGMTSYAQRLFFVNDPSLDSKEELSKHCSGVPTEEAVLGCYRGDRAGIYIYKVDEPLLYGVEQVTAAHEMLHQAYDRLSEKKRISIDALLNGYYTKTLTDPSVKAKMEGYKKSEPHDLKNEMHSVFGTEIAELPAELETYYRQYFTDRQKVVALSKQYQAELDKRKAQIDGFDAQLQSLHAQIDANRSQIDASSAALAQERAAMDALLAADDIPGYNARVPGYNKKVVAHKQLLATTNQLIDTYNHLVEQRNAISVERTQLQDALDSRLDSVKKQ